MSLDLARRLKLQLDHRHRLRVNGIGGIATQITAKAAVKITLGNNVVYFMDLWVGNIGEGVECLLGMDFMVAAGVRLSALEGNVHLPDEERIPLVAPGGRPRLGTKIPVTNLETIYLGPGEYVDVPIVYGSNTKQRLETWVCAGIRWLTTTFLDSDKLPKRIRVVNVSRTKLVLAPRTTVAVLVEHGFKPDQDRCVRVGSTRYREWQEYIFESSHSERYLDRQYERIERQNAILPLAVDRPAYPTPTRILSRQADPMNKEVEPSTRFVRLTQADTPSFEKSGLGNQAELVSDQVGVERSDDSTESCQSNRQPVTTSQAEAIPSAVGADQPHTRSSLGVDTGDAFDILPDPERDKLRVNAVAKEEPVALPAQFCEVQAETLEHDLTLDEIPPSDLGRLNCTREVLVAPHFEHYAATADAQPRSSGNIGVPFPNPNEQTARASAADGDTIDLPGLGLKVATPLDELAQVFKMTDAMRQEVLEEATVFYHEGSDHILLRELKGQLAMLPDMEQLEPHADVDEADAGELDENTPEELERLRAILRKHQVAFLGSGNALPPAARGVICDLEVESGTAPVAQRARRIPGNLLPKVYELLKRLLESSIIEMSSSEWASPIVIVMKKNGVDIRLCIDYRLVNQLIKLLSYPLPLIDELLDNFDAVMWFLSLDMASGFWAISMTERAKLISAFICPLGHFQWVRMPFGLKNAPLIYQKVIDNCLWGFVRLPPWLEKEVDSEVLEFFGVDPAGLGLTRSPAHQTTRPLLRSENSAELAAVATEATAIAPAGSSTRSSSSEVAQPRSEPPVCPPEHVGKTVFDLGIPAPPSMNPVLRRSSYIDDIAYGARDWDDLCETLDHLLFRLRYWGISVSLPKSSFGKRAIPYLSHEVSREGLKATPKILKELTQLPFPKSLKEVQSFLGSLNYYNKFIEGFPILASALYELTDAWIKSGENLERAKRAFELLKSRLVDTPVLKHPDRTKPYVIILHANPWAASAVLGQEYDGVIFPVRFTGRTLHDAELKYHPAEQEILALLRVLTSCYTLVKSQPLKVYTRFSVLKWLFKSKTLQGRCLQWATLLSPWSLEFERAEKDEDGLAALLAASITPREHLDELASQLVPYRSGRVKQPLLSLEMLSPTYNGIAISFDGSAKLKTNAGSASFVAWQLPNWVPIHAEGRVLTNVTVNEAEYHGLLSGLGWAIAGGVQEVVVIGDSRLAIEQCQGTMRANKKNLEDLLAEYIRLRACFQRVQLVHVLRDFNASADYLASKALRLGETFVVDDVEETAHLVALNRLPERMSQLEAEVEAPRAAISPTPLPSGDQDLGVVSQTTPSSAASALSAPILKPVLAPRPQTSSSSAMIVSRTSPGVGSDIAMTVPEEATFSTDQNPSTISRESSIDTRQVFIVQTRRQLGAGPAPEASRPVRYAPSSTTGRNHHHSDTPFPHGPRSDLGQAERNLGQEEPNLGPDHSQVEEQPLEPDEPAHQRLVRIRAHQAADGGTKQLIHFLHGRLDELTWDQCQTIAKTADQYVIDQVGVLRYAGAQHSSHARTIKPRLVVPSSMRNDVLHMCHANFQGGHQGVTRTYERAKREFFWVGLFRDVERYVGACVDCVTSKGLPRNPGPSPGNIVPEYPFQIVSMDFVMPLPVSGRG